MNLTRIWCMTFVLAITLLPYSRNASLTAVELKKFKGFLEGQGLYNSQDDVEVLTVHNFKHEVVNQPHKAIIVEFYNSWCGFCQRFAPSWKALATDIKEWSDLVTVAAIDCADDDNTQICREYEIMAYPTLRYFHENFKEGPPNLGAEVLKGEDLAGHRHRLIDRLILEQIENRGKMYPNLLPYNETDLGSLLQNAPSNVDYAFLIITTPDSYVGPEVALDLHKFKNFVVRYSHNNETQLVSNLHLTHFPSIIAVDRNNNYQIITNATDRKTVRNSIRSYLRSRNIDIGDDTPKNNKEIYTGKWIEAEVPDMEGLIRERARQALRERVKQMGDVVFQMDLEAALKYSLKNEIATRKVIEGDALRALRRYLNVLEKYFPFGSGGKVFLGELSRVANSGESVEGAKLAEIIDKAIQENSQVFSSPGHWLACEGSKPFYRGYPCGLWKLFHYLTVNSAEANSQNSEADPLEVLDVMHSYVKHYFGCSNCSRHFQDMALKLGMRQVASQDSAVIWLWMAHNQVNKRLAGDQTEDPEYPKIQFPSEERCPQCRNPKSGEWNLPEVLKYLKQMYSSLNVRYIGADTRVLHAGLDRSSGNTQNNGSAEGIGSLFKALDMSMCFVLYVVCFFLLALLIRMFLKRGYRKKPYVHDLLGKV